MEPAQSKKDQKAKAKSSKKKKAPQEVAVPEDKPVIQHSHAPAAAPENE
jgi:hypothetical protein